MLRIKRQLGDHDGYAPSILRSANQSCTNRAVFVFDGLQKWMSVMKWETPPMIRCTDGKINWIKLKSGRISQSNTAHLPKGTLSNTIALCVQTLLVWISRHCLKLHIQRAQSCMNMWDMDSIQYHLNMPSSTCAHTHLPTILDMKQWLVAPYVDNNTVEFLVAANFLSRLSK